MFSETVENPAAYFEAQTGLIWPDSADILSVDDTHGGFHGDGEFHVVFKTDSETIQKYLNGAAPFDVSWQTGPIPHEIGFHCSFGTDGVSVGTVNNGPEEYWGDSTLRDVLGSGKVYFAAQERCCESLRWHNGHLIVVDPRSNKVWLSVWDF